MTFLQQTKVVKENNESLLHLFTGSKLNKPRAKKQIKTPENVDKTYFKVVRSQEESANDRLNQMAQLRQSRRQTPAPTINMSKTSFSEYEAWFK